MHKHSKQLLFVGYQLHYDSSLFANVVFAMQIKFWIKIVYKMWHDYTIGTLGVLKACDACADIGQL